jgi:hypothetical protein
MLQVSVGGTLNVSAIIFTVDGNQVTAIDQSGQSGTVGLRWVSSGNEIATVKAVDGNPFQAVITGVTGDSQCAITLQVFNADGSEKSFVETVQVVDSPVMETGAASTAQIAQSM